MPERQGERPCRVRVPGASRRRGMESAGRMAPGAPCHGEMPQSLVQLIPKRAGESLWVERRRLALASTERVRARTATPLARACPRASAFPRWCRRRVRATQPVFRNVRKARRRQESPTIAPHGIAAKGSLPGAPPTRWSSDRGVRSSRGTKAPGDASVGPTEGMACAPTRLVGRSTVRRPARA
jgi:hypothetical protein